MKHPLGASHGNEERGFEVIQWVKGENKEKLVANFEINCINSFTFYAKIENHLQSSTTGEKYELKFHNCSYDHCQPRNGYMFKDNKWSDTVEQGDYTHRFLEPVSNNRSNFKGWVQYQVSGFDLQDETFNKIITLKKNSTLMSEDESQMVKFKIHMLPARMSPLTLKPWKHQLIENEAMFEVLFAKEK